MMTKKVNGNGGRKTENVIGDGDGLLTGDTGMAGLVTARPPGGSGGPEGRPTIRPGQTEKRTAADDQPAVG